MLPEQTKMINISDDNFEKNHIINGVVQSGDELKQYNYLNLGPTHLQRMVFFKIF